MFASRHSISLNESDDDDDDEDKEAATDKLLLLLKLIGGKVTLARFRLLELFENESSNRFKME
jgi:hypothetical protein